MNNTIIESFTLCDTIKNKFSDEEYITELECAFMTALELKQLRSKGRRMWAELYDNEEYSRKLILRDMKFIIENRAELKSEPEPIKVNTKPIPYEVRKNRMIIKLGLNES